MGARQIKARVLKKFINKYSKTIHKKGDIIEVSPKRFKEINSTRFGELVKKIEVEGKKIEGTEE